jgi:hypothetical protein
VPSTRLAGRPGTGLHSSRFASSPWLGPSGRSGEWARTSTNETRTETELCLTTSPALPELERRSVLGLASFLPAGSVPEVWSRSSIDERGVDHLLAKSVNRRRWGSSTRNRTRVDSLRHGDNHGCCCSLLLQLIKVTAALSGQVGGSSVGVQRELRCCPSGAVPLRPSPGGRSPQQAGVAAPALGGWRQSQSVGIRRPAKGSHSVVNWCRLASRPRRPHCLDGADRA